MKLDKIATSYAINNNFKLNNKQNNSIKISSTPINQNYAPLPSTSAYLAFMGYSSNLSQVVEKMPEKDFPPEIKDYAEQSLEKGEKKPLYKIHAEKYKGIDECYTLEDLKEKYPEFKDVISVEDVNARPSSFLGKCLNGEVECFSQDEDLSLQLIKLYWANGFSLSDLTKYIEKNSDAESAKAIYYTMKKLNIPTMSERYGLVLKLSDSDYEEKLREKIKKSTLQAREARLQKEQGEAVYIPRGPLSDEHKAHISQGLKNYYKQNPQAIYEMSQRQKAFYEANPKKGEELTKVLDFAWNKTNEGKKLRKDLSKFLRKEGAKIEDKELLNPENLSKENKTALEKFWNKCPWAHDRFSRAMTKGWNNVKNEVDLSEAFSQKMRIMPQKLIDDIYIWAQKEGKEAPPKEYMGTVFEAENDKEINKEVTQIRKKHNKLVEEYRATHNPIIPNMVVNAQGAAIIHLVEDFERNLKEPPKNSAEEMKEKTAMLLVAYMDELSEKLDVYAKDDNGTRRLKSGVSYTTMNTELQEIYKLSQAVQCPELMTIVERYIDAYYEDFMRQVAQNNLKILSDKNN